MQNVIKVNADKILKGSDTLDSIVGSKIAKYLPAPIGQVSFQIQDKHSNDAIGVLNQLDFTNNTEMGCKNEVTTSPLEDGSEVAEHISRAMATFTISGIVAEYTFRASKTEEAASAVRQKFHQYGRWMPKVGNKVMAEIDKVYLQYKSVANKVDLALSDARKVYSDVKGYGKPTPARKYVEFRNNVVNIQQNCQPLVLKMGGEIYNNVYIEDSKFKINDSNNINNMEVTITLRQIKWASLLQTANSDVVGRAAGRINELNKTAVKATNTGDNVSVAKRIYQQAKAKF